MKQICVCISYESDECASEFMYFNLQFLNSLLLLGNEGGNSNRCNQVYQASRGREREIGETEEVDIDGINGGKTGVVSLFQP